MPVIEIYPGAKRQLVETGNAYSIFDEASLDQLAEFGLDSCLTNPSTMADFLRELTPDRAFPGIRHFNEPRVYLIEGNDGSKCVVKPFPDYYRKRSGLDHLGTQELLHDALQNNKRYDAARVFGHIGVSMESSAGYAIVDYVDAFTYRQAEGPVDHTSSLTRAVTRATVYLRHHKQRKLMLPTGTNLETYRRLVIGARAARDEALADFGVQIPSTISEGKYAGATNWDYNPDNLLCSVDSDGEPTLTTIDQSADLSRYTELPF